MIDSLTKRPICVSTGSAGPSIVVQADQLRDVEGVLRFANINYTVEKGAIQSDGVPAAHVINLHGVDPSAAQAVLDAAVVKVSISLVNGSAQGYFMPESFIERYEMLLREGHVGNELADRLISDDWGAPPSHVTLGGNRSDGTAFRVSWACEPRKRRR